jgi:hypothetical protein
VVEEREGRGREGRAERGVEEEREGCGHGIAAPREARDHLDAEPRRDHEDVFAASDAFDDGTGAGVVDLGGARTAHHDATGR